MTAIGESSRHSDVRDWPAMDLGTDLHIADHNDVESFMRIGLSTFIQNYSDSAQALPLADFMGERLHCDLRDYDFDQAEV